jgi:leucyl-tRNA synthetase
MTHDDRYDPPSVERRWQAEWARTGIYQTDLAGAERPFYNLMMFPYPSAEGLHVGNLYAFTGADIFGRFMAMQGHDVFEPMGSDAFGIHSENFAIKRGIHPRVLTASNVERFRETQLKRSGCRFDWSHEVNTTDPSFYRWTQWIFLQLFKAGLAVRRKAPVNWCPTDQTVLADEQVIEGRCERCDTLVQQRELEQWFLRITAFADRLLTNLDRLDWPASVKTAQRAWIGRSAGLRFSLAVEGELPVEGEPRVEREPRVEGEPRVEREPRVEGEPETRIDVFTTRPETVFGVTYVVLAPEHPLVERLTTPEHRAAVAAYRAVTRTRSELERQQGQREKTGVFTGRYAINPVNDERIPIWIADYVLASYGTGAIMAVPAHDERDLEFAQAFGLPVRQVIVAREPATTIAAPTGPRVEPRAPVGERALADGLPVEPGAAFVGEAVPTDGLPVEPGTAFVGDRALADRLPVEARAPVGEGAMDEPPVEPGTAFVGEGVPMEGLPVEAGAVFGGEGVLVESGQFTGETAGRASERIVDWFEERGLGRRTVQYRLRDWLVSRQRYWGPPIPIVYCAACGVVPVPEDQLPVPLPDVEDWMPRGTGASPLAEVAEFVQTQCPTCGGPARRETDVSDNFLDSAWYFLRYASSAFDDRPFDPALTAKWLPVDMYVGGAEHSVLHLLYSRFITMALHDLGHLPFEEPFTRFRAHGLLSSQGTKMAKSRGNVVNPDTYFDRLGADTLRMYLVFLGPFERGGEFSDRGIGGVRRFLGRVWDLVGRHAERLDDGTGPLEARRGLHRTIRAVSQDLENLRYNTAIAALMSYLNTLHERATLHGEEVASLLLMLAPFAPHLAEELWARIGRPYSIHQQRFPVAEAELLQVSTQPVAVQIDGRTRGMVRLSAEASQADALDAARGVESARLVLERGSLGRVIYIRGRIINLVTTPRTDSGASPG